MSEQRPIRRGTAGLFSLRLILVCSALLLLILILGCYGMTVGRLHITVPQVFNALFGTEDGVRQQVIRNIRLPRVLAGIFVGAALGISGAIFQSISRNVLGSPDIIGFTTGAATGAIMQIVLFNPEPLMVMVAAIIGGLITALVVYLLAMQGGSVRGYRLILIGIGVGAVLSALNGLLLVKGDLDNAVMANLWLAGSVHARSWEHVVPVTVGVCLILPLVLVLTKPLSIMEMGDDIACQLGVPVERVRWIMICCAVVLAALATSATGPIAFVALAAPQLVARLTHSTGVPVTSAALMGASLLLSADLLTQLLPFGLTIPVGRMTGMVGGMYLLWLLTRPSHY